MEEQEKPTVGEIVKNFFAYHWKGLFSIIIPIAFSPIAILNEGKEYLCLYLICVMAIFWVTELIPLYVTSLLPIIMLPIMGIVDSETTCKQYFKDPLVMFLGGLIVALAIEYCNLHKRLALKVILIVGCSPRRLHCGLIFVSMFISMWISNAATTAMMCPIIRAVLEELHAQKVINIYMETDEETPNEEKHPSHIANAFYLGMAYATTIGGCGTLIGTGTNLTFKGLYETRFPDATDKIDFPLFMAYCVILVILDTIALFFCIQISNMGMFRPNSLAAKEVAAAAESTDVVKNIIVERYKDLGPMNMHEIQVIILFLLMVVLLFTRHPGFVPGWADVISETEIRNSMPVMLVVVLLFLFPISYGFCRYCGASGPFTQKETPSLLSWKFVHKNTPWGLVFLLGGGFALAEGSTKSGMAKMLGNALSGMKVLPHVVVQFISIVVAVFLTAFSSNVAIANILIPVLAELAIAIKVHPLYLVFPAGLGCSFAFHLPVSTPPNAIVAGYANIQTKHMAVAGIMPTIITIILLVINGQTLHNLVYPNSEVLPDWAK